MTLLLLLFCSTLSHALLRDAGDFHGPERRCDLAAVNSCIADHKAGKEQAEANTRAIDDKIGALSTRILSTQAIVNTDANEIRSWEITKLMAEKERASAAEAENTVEKSFIAENLFLENIFFMQPESNSWNELHAGVRRARLDALVTESVAQIEGWELAQRKLAMEITALSEESITLQVARAGQTTDANIHASMCQNGCSNHFCPE